jgi:hypothetical protein
VQILRELQGLKLLDKNDTSARSSQHAIDPAMQGAHGQVSGRVDPVMNAFNVKKDAKKTRDSNKKSFRKVAFSRETYLKDVRTNLVGGMLFAILVLILTLGLMFSGTSNYLLPNLEALEQQSETIKRLPADLKSVNEQIASQTTQQKEIATQLENLIRFFPNPHQAYSSYSTFLTLLEGHKIAVTKQKGGVTQTPANPLLSEQASKSKDGKPAAAPPVAAMMMSGDMKPGLNYYHLSFTLEGSYVGYLSARQALVNENPNMVVHSESVISLKDRPSTLEITALVSIPFIHKP